ncbi:MAG: histidine kinase [Spirochaetales bacterium]|nr:histidine kinase [Spirochaetales bacterium]
MSIRYKLLILTSLMFFSLATITGLSLWNWQRLQSLNETILQGQQLQTYSRKVMGLMKDMIFDLFSPHMYSQIRSLTYSPRSVAAYREWYAAVNEYQDAFIEFIDDRELNIMQDDELQDLYETSLTLNQKALEKLHTMSEILVRLQSMNSQEIDLYNVMQQDETLTPFFEEFRDTSFYFTNTFESFMNHFFTSFRRQSEKLERELYILFILISVLSSATAISYAMIISREILKKINLAGTAFRNIAMGDFSTVYPVKDDDELSTLLGNINSLSSDLKENINSILNLTGDIGRSIGEKSSLSEIMDMVTETIIKDTQSEKAAVYIYEAADNCFKLRSSRGTGAPLIPEFNAAEELGRMMKTGTPYMGGEKDCPSPPLSPDSRYKDMLALPLKIRGECRGFLVSLLYEHSFSDLGITRMINFSEFVSLTLDNHLKYREVLEKREAQYWALQSQVQPHFIYNVLNGFIGLNRMGDKERLERAILSLREMLRYVTDQKHLTTLKDEVNFLENYCKLQKIRFSERLKYSFEIHDGLERVPIPRLLLQPLVENSIIHGLEPLEEGGELTLSARRHSDSAVITISDTGVGFDCSAAADSRSIGMKNVSERLMMTNPGSEIQINSTPGKGTVVKLTIAGIEEAGSENSYSR